MSSIGQCGGQLRVKVSLISAFHCWSLHGTCIPWSAGDCRALDGPPKYYRFSPGHAFQLKVGAKMASIAKGTRVLIVDDEQVIADSLALILNKSGFEASAVYSGEKAVEMAEVMKPNVLISDVIMRGMNGIEAAILISGHRPDCRVILFSGNASTTDLLKDAVAEGLCFELLSKPVHPRVILDRLAGLQ